MIKVPAKKRPRIRVRKKKLALGVTLGQPIVHDVTPQALDDVGAIIERSKRAVEAVLRALAWHGWRTVESDGAIESTHTVVYANHWFQAREKARIALALPTYDGLRLARMGEDPR